MSLVHIGAILVMKGSVGVGWCCGPAGKRNRLLLPGQSNVVSSNSAGDPCIFKYLQNSRVSCPHDFQAMHCDNEVSVFNNSRRLFFFPSSWSREILVSQYLVILRALKAAAVLQTGSSMGSYWGAGLWHWQHVSSDSGVDNQQQLKVKLWLSTAAAEGEKHFSY